MANYFKQNNKKQSVVEQILLVHKYEFIKRIQDYFVF